MDDRGSDDTDEKPTPPARSDPAAALDTTPGPPQPAQVAQLSQEAATADPAPDFMSARPPAEKPVEPVDARGDAIVPPPALHVYTREIDEDERTSLTALVGRVHRGATVLDLGTGSGAIGEYLSERKDCTVDGVTYNAAEARIAAPHYRSVAVADLSECDLPALFAGQRYDYVICADVLEHLPAPERVLAACHALLEPGGRLLVSVPNTAYAGLIAELIAGEFRYREEGLLDATHVRHFTRRALMRFLGDGGFAPEAVEPITVALPDSEFRAAFDALPPAVSRHLLAGPDALTYQFIVVARAAETEAAQAQAMALATPAAGEPAPADAAALFTSQLYFGRRGEYSESAKQVVPGVIGRERQTLRFTLPGPEAGVTNLRFDPADRPGFLHLHRIRLLDAEGGLAWQWDSRHDGIKAFADVRRSQMLLEPPWPLAGAAVVVLLHGDDPWLELPIPEDVVAANAGNTLEIELGWPMSADYLALSGVAHDLSGRVAKVEADAARKLAEQDAEVARKLAERDAQAVAAQRLADQLIQSEREKAEREKAEHEAQLAAARLTADQRTEDAALATRQLEKKQAALAHLHRKVKHKNLTSAQMQQRIIALKRRLEQVSARSEELRGQQDALLARSRTLSRERDGAVEYIEWLQQSTVFRVTRPAVRAKMALDRVLGVRRDSGLGHGVQRGGTGDAAAGARPAGHAMPRPSHPVDVIVPVYRGLADTRLCIESVLAADCATRFRLVVINDASPEVEVTQYLRDAAAADERIVLLENEENLGFVGTVNRGMALSPANDVLLLNSDTEVANDWLDRLRAAAYSDVKVASVTPFSNNATICSYPRFCEDNELPPGFTTARLDALFARSNAQQTADVPTGIGFCMYVRRDCLDEIGLFDLENFGKGYGEENDFCQRALAAGWRNLHALDTFVMHSGGVSFGDSKSPREAAAMQTLRRLHPGYEPQVHEFLAVDPARLARLSVDLARIAARGLPAVLAVLHDRGGGTARHVRELAVQQQDHFIVFTLRPAGNGAVLLELAGESEGFALSFDLPTGFEALLSALRALDIRLVHYHHLLGHGDLMSELPGRLGLPYDFTVHDFYTVCPQITFSYAAEPGNRYCGEQGVSQCNRCLARSPAPGGLDIETWRLKHGDFLRGARQVLAPSQAAARHIARYVPRAQLRVVPHTDIDREAGLPVPQPARLADAAPLRVAVVGALSPIKGADLLEDVATAAAKAGAPIDFHLIGFAYRTLRTQPRARLTVHGEYRDEDLPGLLEWLKPDLVWFPAIWPETYSYTLSACLEAGLPVAAPDLGAFPERLANRAWSWILRWDQTPAQWLAFFEDIRQRCFVAGRPPSAPSIRLAVQHDEPETELFPETGWSYRKDYLRGLEAPPASGGDPAVQPRDGDPPLMGRAFLAAHLPDRCRGGLNEMMTRGVKGRLLRTALRLRAMPALSGVARSIPLRWQTRFKSWLRA